MICKIIRAIIYVENVLKQRCALYFLLWNMKKTRFLLYVFLRDCRNRPIACCHKDTWINDAEKMLDFCNLHIQFYMLLEYQYEMMFFKLCEKRGSNRPYRKWSFNYLDILDSPEMTTYILCIILIQLNKYQYSGNNRSRTFNI